MKLIFHKSKESNKVLVVTYSHDPFCGGTVCSKRNYRALYSVFGIENIEFFDVAKFSYSNKYNLLNKIFNKISNFIYGRYIYLGREIENTLMKKTKNVSVVFINNSIYGLIARKIKKKNPQIKIISFFHNVELDYHKEIFGDKKELILKVFRSEKMTCKYSDIAIALNLRDAQRIEQIYEKKIDAVIPISFADKPINFNKGPISKNLTALFFGSNFPPNTEGVRWFVENVLPFVNIKLQIIMKDVDKENLPKCEDLELFGFVEDLEPYIQNADILVFPIFKGSGMKVKTCEALMHGKNIIGTKEAFEGYDIDCDKAGMCCETAEEFINAINVFSEKFTNKFNGYSRNVFLEKYNDEITLKQFTELF